MYASRLARVNPRGKKLSSLKFLYLEQSFREELEHAWNEFIEMNPHEEAPLWNRAEACSKVQLHASAPDLELHSQNAWNHSSSPEITWPNMVSCQAPGALQNLNEIERGGRPTKC
jgi:hypothetical protein